MYPFMGSNRVRGLGKSLGSPGRSAYEEEKSINFQDASINTATRTTSVYFEQTGRIDVPVYLLQDLQVGTQVHGGALILDDSKIFILNISITPFSVLFCTILKSNVHCNYLAQTLVIDPKATAKILPKHVLIKLN